MGTSDKITPAHIQPGSHTLEASTVIDGERVIVTFDSDRNAASLHIGPAQSDESYSASSTNGFNAVSAPAVGYLGATDPAQRGWLEKLAIATGYDSPPSTLPDLAPGIARQVRESMASDNGLSESEFRDIIKSFHQLDPAPRTHTTAPNTGGKPRER